MTRTLVIFLSIVSLLHFSVLQKNTPAVAAMSSESNIMLRSCRHYIPPSWCTDLLCNPPKHGRLSLANLPTPLYRLIGGPQSAIFEKLDDLGISLFVKRDDSTGGVELGGNKIRKLEFLLADALANHCDSVVTIGGEQSNHCRATAAASRMLGLEPHLVLRRQSTASDSDIGFIGNLLIDRMIGSSIYTCTAAEYRRLGSDELVSRLCMHLTSLGKRPYPIPVGGSNAIGTWGYIVAVDELLSQWNSLVSKEKEKCLDHVVFACGSGGTAAGLSLGFALAHGAMTKNNNIAKDNRKNDHNRSPCVHAVGVCDSPEYFYEKTALIAEEMGLQIPEGLNAQDVMRSCMTVHDGKGLGYAQSTLEELSFINTFAQDTGIVLDPVYTGKALFCFMNLVERDPEAFRGKNVLFWHTGGALGLYDKTNDLADNLLKVSPCHRLDMYGKGNGIDLSKSSSHS